MPELPPPRDPEASEFLAWLRGLDHDDLGEYLAELEAFSDEPEGFGAFARAALPIVRAVAAEREARDLLRPTFEQVFGASVDFDRIWEALGALKRASTQLGSDTPPEDLLVAAFEAAGFDPAGLPATREDT